MKLIPATLLPCIFAVLLLMQFDPVLSRVHAALLWLLGPQ